MTAQSLRDRANMAHSLCVLAEAQIEAGKLTLAKETVRQMRSVLAGIRVLLDRDTSYLPEETIRELAELLAGISNKASAMEARLGPDTVH